MFSTLVWRAIWLDIGSYITRWQKSRVFARASRIREGWSRCFRTRYWKMNGSSVHSADRLKTRSYPLSTSALLLIFFIVPTTKYIPIKSEQKNGNMLYQNARQVYGGIISLMNMILSNMWRECVGWFDNLPAWHKISAQRMKQKNRRQSIDEDDMISGKERENRTDKRDKNALISPRYIMHTRAYTCEYTYGTNRALGAKHKPRHKPGGASVRHKTRNAMQCSVTDAIY